MTQLTVTCPNGHRLRGPQDLSGRSVRCPKCAVKFTFAVPESKQVTDTGVMRILGDVAPLPPPPVHSELQERPCPRCELAISLTTTVCRHCSCYVGIALPAQAFHGKSGTNVATRVTDAI